MFRCQVTGKLIKPEFVTKVIKDKNENNTTVRVRDPKSLTYNILFEIRPKKYLYFKGEEGIREVTEEQLLEIYKNTSFREREKFYENSVIRSEGYEPARVLTVSYDVYIKHLEKGGKTI
jgi:hypothetical protein